MWGWGEVLVYMTNFNQKFKMKINRRAGRYRKVTMEGHSVLKASPSPRGGGGPLTWRGCESHHTIVGESAGFKFHTFLPSFYFHFPLWEEKGRVVFSPVTQIPQQTLFKIYPPSDCLNSFPNHPQERKPHILSHLTERVHLTWKLDLAGDAERTANM